MRTPIPDAARLALEVVDPDNAAASASTTLNIVPTETRKTPLPTWS